MRLQLGAEFLLALRLCVRGWLIGLTITVPNALFALARRDLIHCAASRNRKRLLLQDIGSATAARFFILTFNQKPILVPIAIPPAHSHQMPSAAKLFAFEREIEMTLGVALMGVAFRNPAAAIPDHHCAAAVFSLRNSAFEGIIFDWVVLDVHG